MVGRDFGHSRRLYVTDAEGCYPLFASGILKEVGDFSPLDLSLNNSSYPAQNAYRSRRSYEFAERVLLGRLAYVFFVTLTNRHPVCIKSGQAGCLTYVIFKNLIFSSAVLIALAKFRAN
jgi:hypothetical protein